MQYRKFGKLDFEVSALGFGCMRLPQYDQDMSHIDEAESIRIIRYGIDHGINYVDTAAPYAMGNSERVLGKALQDGYRQKVKLATKLTPPFIKSRDDFDRFFNEQLERLQTDKINFYLLHGLNKHFWDIFKEWKAIDFVERKIAEGQVDYIGFSFHDDFTVFKEIVDYYNNWDFCQIQYNYIDIERQAGRRGLEYAAAKNLPVVVMEPLRGGLLTKKPPEAVSRVWDSSPVKRSQAEWGLQWLWNQPEVTLVLSGMNNMQQVVENVIAAGRSGVGKLSKEEAAIVDKAREAYLGSTPIPCTKCQYCMPCPNDIDIPRIFGIYNEAVMFDDFRGGTMQYMGGFDGLKKNQRANNCIECEECVEKCPQQISIPEWLKKAHEKLFDPDFRPPF